jgi:hypothetical protein
MALMLRSVSFALILIFGAVDLPAQEQEKTPAKELTQYVRDAQKAGLKDAQIQQNAVKAGWPEQLVTEAIGYVHGAPKVPAAKADSPAATSSVPVAPKTAAQEEKPAQASATPTAPANIVPRNASSAEPDHAGSVKPAAPNRGVSDEYRIGEGDVLQIAVWGEPGASVPSVMVRPDGMITIPLIKDVRAAA